MIRAAGTLLGGRVLYDQPVEGYRTGLEPVLLAASVPAVAGSRVLEAGCGAGAGLLCLAARVPGVHGLGVERDPALAALAAANMRANGFAGLTAACGDIVAWRTEAVFDHAFANPPWHDPAGQPSPVPGRRTAKQAHPGLLAAWTDSLARALRPGGTLSLILPARGLGEAMLALRTARCRGVTVIPLWPRNGMAAKLVILRATRLGRGGDRVTAGLTLHAADGFTAVAEAILREGAALDAPVSRRFVGMNQAS